MSAVAMEMMKKLKATFRILLFVLAIKIMAQFPKRAIINTTA